MMPDMAHQLWGKWAGTAEPTHGATMNFFRRDKEAVSVPAELREDGAGRSVDWSDVVSIPHKAVGGGVYYLLKAGGRALPPQLNTSLWYSARDKMIQDAVTYFLGYERVRTNRLHAMLLALLLGRKVNAFDNSYGKLTRYIDAWLAPCVQHEMAGR
jgi:pyruvyl transferase EpsO